MGIDLKRILGALLVGGGTFLEEKKKEDEKKFEMERLLAADARAERGVAIQEENLRGNQRGQAFDMLEKLAPGFSGKTGSLTPMHVPTGVGTSPGGGSILSGFAERSTPTPPSPIGGSPGTGAPGGLPGLPPGMPAGPPGVNYLSAQAGGPPSPNPGAPATFQDSPANSQLSDLVKQLGGPEATLGMIDGLNSSRQTLDKEERAGRMAEHKEISEFDSEQGFFDKHGVRRNSGRGQAIIRSQEQASLLEGPQASIDMEKSKAQVAQAYQQIQHFKSQGAKEDNAKAEFVENAEEALDRRWRKALAGNPGATPEQALDQAYDGLLEDQDLEKHSAILRKVRDSLWYEFVDRTAASEKALDNAESYLKSGIEPPKPAKPPKGTPTGREKTTGPVEFETKASPDKTRTRAF